MSPKAPRTGRTAVVAATLVCCLLGAAVQAAPPRDRWPGGDWPAAQPAQVGFAPAGLAAAEDYIERRLPRLRSLMVVRDGRLVLERHRQGGARDRLAPVHSITKTVTALLAGIALDEGALAGLDLTLEELFPDRIEAAPDPRTRRVTLAQLLSMTPGLAWQERGPGFWDWNFSRDRVKAALRLGQAAEPGSAFTYSTATSHLIAVAVAEATGGSLLDYANERLFGPIGERIAFWARDGAGYVIGGSGLALSPMQMSKLGFLLLNDGVWDGQRVLPEGWLREATRDRRPGGRALGYGYQLWLRDMAGCAGVLAWGRGGQFIALVPEKDLLVVVASVAHVHSGSSQVFLPLFDLIAAAADDGCGVAPPPLPQAQAAPPATPPSDQAIAAAAVTPPPEVAAFLESFGALLSGGDPAALAGFLSERYLANGFRRDSLVAYLGQFLPQLGRSRIALSRFERRGELAALDGVLVSETYGRLPLEPLFGALIREDGAWRWYGNQRED